MNSLSSIAFDLTDYLRFVPSDREVPRYAYAYACGSRTLNYRSLQWARGMDNNTEDSASLKRSRTHIACEICRKRKIRCDSLKPTCSNCIRSNATCIYPEDGRRKRNRDNPVSSSSATSPENTEHINDRLKRVEQLLESLVEAQIGNGEKKRRTTSSASSVSFSESEESDARVTPRSIGNTPESLNNGTNGNAEPVLSEKHHNNYHNKGHKQSDTIKEEIYEDDRHSNRNHRDENDLLHLSDRRSPVVIKLGDDEPLVTYTHGFTTQLLNPTLMRNLCEKIGCKKLGKAADNRLTALWRYKLCQILNEFVDVDVNPSKLDPHLIQGGLEMFRQNSSLLLNLMCDERDIEQVRRMCCPTGDFHQIDYVSPYSLLYLVMILQYCDPKLPHIARYSQEYILEQSTIAFKLCLRSFVPGAHSTFLLLRLQMLAIIVLYRRMYFPQLRALVAMSLSMAYDLGLHRLDGSRLLTPEEQYRRLMVWISLRDLDVKLSSTVGIVALSSGNEWPLEEVASLEFKDNPEVSAMLTATKLNIIYVDMIDDLFSQRAQRYSVKELMKKLCKIINRLSQWWEELPETAKVLMRMIEQDDSKTTSMYSKTPEYFDHPYDTPPGGATTPKSTTSTDNGPSPITTSPSIQTDASQSEFLSITQSENIAQRIYVSTLLCYYHILQLAHSIPAFSPSSLKVYDHIPSELVDSLNILNHCSLQILRLSFNKEGLQSLGYLPITATNAFSAMFLKQIRAPHHPTNRADIELIYQYIHRFRDIQVKDSLSPCNKQGNLVYTLWCTFASILTQVENMRLSKTSEDQRSQQQQQQQQMQQQRQQQQQQQPPLQENIPYNISNNLRSPPPVQPIYQQESNIRETQHHGLNSMMTPQTAILPQTPHQIPVQQQVPMGGVTPQAGEYMPQSAPYLPSDLYQETFDANPEYSLWDAFNNYNGIEVDVPPQNMPHGGNPEVDQSLNNCIIS